MALQSSRAKNRFDCICFLIADWPALTADDTRCPIRRYDSLIIARPSNESNLPKLRKIRVLGSFFAHCARTLCATRLQLVILPTYDNYLSHDISFNHVRRGVLEL